MANRVRISTIGAAPLGLQPTVDVAEALDLVRKQWEKEIRQVLPDRPDLIVLPEACDLPGHWPPRRIQEYYRARGNRMLDFFAGVAREHRCYIAYAAVREADDGTWRNSVILLDRRGEIAGIYNKNHVTMAECDDYGVLYGSGAPIIECDFGRVACAICFDLNFEELRLRYAAARPDLIIFCSMYHGGLMQAYWAYSCRCHLVSAVSRLPSAILSPVGTVIASSTNYFDFVTATVNLDCLVAHLDDQWDRLKALKEKYGRDVSIFDPGLLGPVLITSESEGRTAREMATEFSIEPIDDYFARCRAHRAAPGRIEA